MTLSLKISKSAKRVLVTCLIALLAMELIDVFWPETMALTWHVRHGFRVRCCGFEVRVPMRYLGNEDHFTVSLFSTPGYVRAKFFHSPYAMMLLSEFPRVHTGQDNENLETGVARVTAMYESSGYKLVQKRPATIADKQLECWEFYTEHFDHFGPQFEVMCYGHGNDMAASFTGSPSMLNEFYSTLESARPASR
jgi:hypothetical protein